MAKALDVMEEVLFELVLHLLMVVGVEEVEC